LQIGRDAIDQVVTVSQRAEIEALGDGNVRHARAANANLVVVTLPAAS